MTALAAVIATEAIAARIETDSEAASSQHQQRDSHIDTDSISAVPFGTLGANDPTSAVVLVSTTSELTQSDEELVRAVETLHHFAVDTLPGIICS